jgi:arylesterase / paraoxonase
MANLLSRFAIVGVVFVAVAYQFIFKSIIFDTLGYGRTVLSIKDFPDIRCEKITELGLEGCEDMWLHEPTGFLYLACSDSQSRTQWLPAWVEPIPESVQQLTIAASAFSMPPDVG